MDPMNSQHVLAFRESLEAWTDQRFVCREDIETLAMFSMYLVNLLEAAGVEYRGHTYKWKDSHGLLVVKGDIEGIPHVVFSSGRTHTGCVRAFLRKLREGWLEWVVDRYRQ